MNKTIMYLSRSTEDTPSGGLPPGMASVIVKSRANNRAAEISAFLCFHQGDFLQILEGEAGVVDALYRVICDDWRHDSVVTLLDKPVDQTFFTGQHFKLTSVYQEAPELAKYINAHLASDYHHGTSIENIFADLQQNRGKSADSKAVAENSAFAGKAVRLKSWPRFDLMKPTRETLELCARIAKSPIAHGKLCSENPYRNRSELDGALFRLKEMGLLELTDAVDSSGGEDARGGFFQSMKNFINRVAA
ncbi:MAG: BLUF domain-containing protein [Pseudomonadota bacterium]